MSISKRTRKILWGKSGNRCAICRGELTVDATSKDDESIVGDECHIVSGKTQGPRSDRSFPVERLDDPSNLILLCRVHHKMVDDQHKEYSPERLRTLKADHEKWVASNLADGNRLRIRRIKENVSSHLLRLTSGKDVMEIVANACAYSFEHDDPESPVEVQLVAGFLQEAQDFGELSVDLEAGDRVNAAYKLNTLLGELEHAGFWVFGAREVQRLEGGVGPPSSWPLSIIRIVRTSNPGIIKLNLQRKSATCRPACDLLV